MVADEADGEDTVDGRPQEEARNPQTLNEQARPLHVSVLVKKLQILFSILEVLMYVFFFCSIAVETKSTCTRTPSCPC